MFTHGCKVERSQQTQHTVSADQLRGVICSEDATVFTVRLRCTWYDFHAELSVVIYVVRKQIHQLIDDVQRDWLMQSETVNVCDVVLS